MAVGAQVVPYLRNFTKIVVCWINRYNWIRLNLLPTGSLVLICLVVLKLSHSKKSIFKNLSEGERQIGRLDIDEIRKVLRDRAPIYGTLTGLSLAVIVLLFSAKAQFPDLLFGEILVVLFIAFISFFVALIICHTASAPYFFDQPAVVTLLRRSHVLYLLGTLSMAISVMLCLLAFSEVLFYTCLGIAIGFGKYYVRPMKDHKQT